MTQTEKRIAIAMDRGWNVRLVEPFKVLYPPNSVYGMCCGKHLTDKEVREAGLEGDENGDCKFPDYFTSAAAAVELLEALRREHFVFPVLQVTREGWIVEIETVHGITLHKVTDPTFAAAVAEAYGRARNLWTA